MKWTHDKFTLACKARTWKNLIQGYAEYKVVMASIRGSKGKLSLAKTQSAMLTYLAADSEDFEAVQGLVKSSIVTMLRLVHALKTGEDWKKLCMLNMIWNFRTNASLQHLGPIVQGEKEVVKVVEKVVKPPSGYKGKDEMHLLELEAQIKRLQTDLKTQKTRAEAATRSLEGMKDKYEKCMVDFKAAEALADKARDALMNMEGDEGVELGMALHEASLAEAKANSAFEAERKATTAWKTLRHEMKKQTEVFEKEKEDLLLQLNMMRGSGANEYVEAERLREELAQKLGEEQDKMRKEKERLAAETKKAAEQAAIALDSLANMDGDNAAAMKMLLDKQNDMGAKMMQYKSEMKLLHHKQLLASMRFVFKAAEQQTTQALLSRWKTEKNVWQQQMLRQKELEKAVKNATDPLNAKIEMLTKERDLLKEKLKNQGMELKAIAKKAGVVGLFSLFLSLARHNTSRLRLTMTHWHSVIHHAKAVRRIESELLHSRECLAEVEDERVRVTAELRDQHTVNTRLQRETGELHEEKAALISQYQEGAKELYKKLHTMEAKSGNMEDTIQKWTDDAKKAQRANTQLRMEKSALQMAIQALKEEMLDRKEDQKRLGQMFDVAARALLDEKGQHNGVNQALLSVHWIVCKVYTLLFNAMKKSALTGNLENPLTADWKMEEESSLLHMMEANKASDIVQWDEKMLNKAYHWLRLKLVEKEIRLDPIKGQGLGIGTSSGGLMMGNRLSNPPKNTGSQAPGASSIVGFAGNTTMGVVDALNLLRTLIDKPVEIAGP